ncbi:MAG: hypothetical protein QXH39_05730 [Conexivisphaerales archaeon]
MSHEHDFRLEGIRQVYIDDELVGSIDFYRCSKCSAVELAARKIGEETEQTYGFNNYSDKWFVIYDGKEWNVVRSSSGRIIDIDGKEVNLNDKIKVEVNSPNGEIRLYTKSAHI